MAVVDAAERIAAAYRDLAAVVQAGSAGIIASDDFLARARALQTEVAAAGLPSSDPLREVVDLYERLPPERAANIGVGRAFLACMGPHLPRQGIDLQVESERLGHLIRGGQGAPTTISRRGEGQSGAVIRLDEPKDRGLLGMLRRAAQMVGVIPPSLPETAAGTADPSHLAELGTLVDEDGYLKILVGKKEKAEVSSKYRILRLLGRGGMAEVYLAIDTEIDREVAIKIVNPPAENRALVAEMMQRERRTMGRFHVAGVTEIHDTGDTADNRPFIVMEYFPRGMLLDWIAQNFGSLSPETLLNIFTRIVAHVAQAHRRGIVHRDLKLENIFVGEVDGEVFPVIGDWGTARRLDELATLTTTPHLPSLRTQSELVGTPGLMSLPRYHWGPDDPSSDTYALGAIAYAMVTGVLPFQADSIDDEIKLMIEHPVPPRPSEIFPDRPIGRHFEAVVMKALEFETGAHGKKSGYADAGAMLFDLVMIEPLRLEQESDALLRMPPGTHIGTRKENTKDAMDILRAAILAAKGVDERYPDDRIKAWIATANRKLHDLAERRGEEEVRLAAARAVSRYAPGSAIAVHVNRPVGYSLFLDGLVPDGAEPILTIFKLQRKKGFYEIVDRPFEVEAPRAGRAWNLDLEPGYYRARLTDRMHIVHPVERPLVPHRPVSGRHLYHFPVHRMEKIPAGDWLIMPAGPAAVPFGVGSPAEYVPLEDYRVVAEDRMISALLTIGDWHTFVADVLSTEGPKNALEMVPATWSTNARTMISQGKMPAAAYLGLQSHLNTPVSDVTAAAARKYIEYQVTRGVLPLGTRFLTPDERRRFYQGDDARRTPDMRDDPLGGTYGARLQRWAAHRRVLPNDLVVDGIEIRDLPAFTVHLDDGKRITSPHATANLRIYLHDDDTPRFAAGVGITETELRQAELVGGVSFGKPLPRSLDILDTVPKSFRGDVGVRLSAPLTQDDSRWLPAPTPSLDSLAGN